MLGLCFGGQMLARVLGGEVSRGDIAEIGWLPVRTTDPELVPQGPWFQWHFDTFTTPPGATLIAESDVAPQAFVWGRSLGLQFHPEVTPEIMHDWVREYRHELDAGGRRPGRAARRDRPQRRGEPADRAAAARALPRRRSRGSAGPRPRDDPHRRLGRVPPLPRPAVPEHRARRGRLADDDGRAADPRRVFGRRDGGLPRSRRRRDRRCRGRAGREDLVLLQPPLHERAAGTARRPPPGVHARDGPRSVRVRRVRGERDGAAARAALSRRTRGHRPLARDLARAGVPRLLDGNARADRTQGRPGAVHPVPRLPPAHPAVDLADRPDRGGRPRRARPPARTARPRARGVRLRTGDRGRPPRLLPARTLLAGPRRTPAGARVPDLLRRGRHRRSAVSGAGSPRTSCRSSPTSSRSARGSAPGTRRSRGSWSGRRSTRRSIGGRASSTSATRGTARPCPRPSVSRCST